MIETVKVQNTNDGEPFHKDSRLETKLRRIQAIYGQRSLLLCLPIEFTHYLRITKGDYVKCRIIDNQLIVEKAEVV
jgi:hypothetical protein